MDNIKIRKVEEADFDGLVNLYDAVWPDVDFDKRAKANFVLNESKGVSFCAEAAGQIVGSRTSFYENMFFGKRKISCVQCGDSCVHPSWRGKGLFQLMNKSFLKGFFEEQRGDLVFNISVLASKKSYEKLGWNYIESLMKLIRFPRFLTTLFKINFNIRKLKEPIIWDHKNDVSVIDSKLLRLREELFSSRHQLLYINYDEKTFYWRLKTESGIKSFISPNNGYVLYKIGHRGPLVEVEIGEVFLYDYTKSSFKRIFKALNESLKPDIIWVMVSEGHPLWDYYRSLFWANPKQKYLYHGVRVESDEMRKICYNPRNWAISSLDIDTF